MLTKYAEMRVLEASRGTMRPSSQVTAGRRTAHRAVFAYEPREGFIYVRSRAISSRCNDNFDEFPAEEIKQAYATFVGKPVFVNHHNDDHRRARGVILDAVLHEDVNPDGSPDTWVEVLMEVDAVKFPKLAKAILAGHIDRTSMGTDVAYSVCSVCANKASTPLEYCKHIPGMKGQTIWQTTASGTKEGTLVREICYGLHFFENSLLVEDPADPTAFFLGVDDRGVGGGYQGDVKVAASQRSTGDDDAQGISREALRQHVGRRDGLAAVASVRRFAGHRPSGRRDGGRLRLKQAAGGRALAVDKNAQRQYMNLAPDVRTAVNRTFRQVRSGAKTIKPLSGHPKKYRAKFTVNGVFYVMLIEDVGAYDRVRWVGTHEDANKTVYKVSSRRRNSLEVVNMGKRNRRRQREAVSRKQGYGETKAPQQVDTLRPEEDEGSVEPVPPFDDPDLDAAREMDLREELGDFDEEGGETDEALLSEVSEILNEVRQMLAPDSVEEQVRDQLADIKEMMNMSDGLEDAEEGEDGEEESDSEESDEEGEEDLPEFMTSDDEEEEDEEDEKDEEDEAGSPVMGGSSPKEGVNRRRSLEERRMSQARRRRQAVRRVPIQPRLASDRRRRAVRKTADLDVRYMLTVDLGSAVRDFVRDEMSDGLSTTQYQNALWDFALTQATSNEDAIKRANVALNDMALGGYDDANDVQAELYGYLKDNGIDDEWERLQGEWKAHLRQARTGSRRRSAHRRTAAVVRFGDLQVGDQFIDSSRPELGVMTLMCPVGQCRHEERDDWSAHVRFRTGVEGFHAAYLDEQVEVVGHTDNTMSVAGSRRRPSAARRRTASTRPCQFCGKPVDADVWAEEGKMCLECSNDYYNEDLMDADMGAWQDRFMSSRNTRTVGNRKRLAAGTTVTMQGDQSERIFDAYSDRTYSAAEINGATMLSMNEDAVVHLRLKNGNEAFVQSIDLDYHTAASRPSARRTTARSKKMSSTLRTLAEVKRLLQEVKKNQRAVQAQVNYIAKAAGLERQLKVVRKRADAENPAQPVAEPAAVAPAMTTEEARDHTDAGLMTPGGVAEVSDVSAEYEVDVMTPGGDYEVELTDGGDVTAPVSGTTEPNSYDEMVTNPEVQYRDLDTEVAYEESQPLFGEEAKEARFVAALRLARLRLQAGIAKGDDLTLATTIAQSKMKTSAIRQEIKTLDEVVKAGQKKPVGRSTARRLVPKAAGRSAPSMATEAAVTPPTAPLGVSSEEFLWD